MSLGSNFTDIENLTRKLAKKGWRIVRVAIEHEDGEKPLCSITVQYDPEKLSDAL